MQADDDLDSQNGGGGAASSILVDLKVVNKPSTFKGSSKAEFMTRWRSWKFTFINYMSMLHEHYNDELEMVGQLATPCIVATQQQQRSRTLYAILASLMIEGTPSEIIQSTKQQN